VERGSASDQHGRGCRSAPAIQHCGRAGLTAALRASREPPSSKHKSGRLAGAARSADFGHKRSPSRAASHARASTNAGLGSVVPKHLLVAEQRVVLRASGS
jgi:hypothetical protein